MIRKFLFIGLFSGLLSLGYLASIIPIDDILSLKKGYISKSLVEGEISYSVVSKRPKDWKKLQELSKTTYGAFIVSEDWSFYEHMGIDVAQLEKAVVDWVKGKRKRGASTISQQFVKNMWLSREKTLTRKLKEALITLVVDKVLGKNKVLECYLNIIEFGKDLYGIENASQYYFSRSSSKLSAKQSAFLAMLLPNPIRYSESFKKKDLTEFAGQTVASILNKMKVAKFLSQEELENSQLEVLWKSPSLQSVQNLWDDVLNFDDEMVSQ